MNRSDLLGRIYWFYPRGLSPWSIGYEQTDERLRQIEAKKRAVDDYPRWKAMLRRISERYSIWDWSLYLVGKSWGPAYSGWIYIPGYMVGCHVALLEPCYGIHRLGGPGEEEAARDLAQKIEAAYP